MPRLLRPAIVLETKLRVLLRQMGEMWPDPVVAAARANRNLGAEVDERFVELCLLLAPGEEVIEMHLDHDPPLAAREKVFRRGAHVGYKPDANDPEFLIYRLAKEHRLKTNVRGEHGQHPDRVLIAKARRLERREQEMAGLRKPRPKAKIKSASRWPAKGSRPLNPRRKG